MTGKSLFMAGVSLLLAAILNTEASACRSCMNQGWNSTYNGYCNNQNWGWYGARKSVTSIEEARRTLEEYYAGSEVMVGRITEKTGYFQADILSRGNKLMDRVIIHKRSGRIRSIR
ncbi:hypothetical protein ET418_12940 [Oryzomonas rubra]|uniref:PepSY domain-containing protein n=1 Tax=Oryzomonas rubra TaxID=2509454 RepID=A0A5A9XBP4_9BACT|nr:hypothetical protein ET418_12940 [Oryzomonas rubra]